MTTLTPEPIVRLENYFRDPYDLTVATARTCYAPRVISTADVSKDAPAREQRDRIASGIYKAGHHTTIQHATFQFVLEKVSRQCIWSFLHSHPHYNSEQVSQRYVEVKPEHFTIPPLDEPARTMYIETIRRQMEAYQRLIQMIEPLVAAEYRRLFPARSLEEKRWQSAIKKRAQEVARYVLPVATHAHLYHTISGLTLYRYHRLCQEFDCPLEQRLVVDRMMEEVAKIDPQFLKLAEDPLPLTETLEYQTFLQLVDVMSESGKREFIHAFDQSLEGHTSKLVDYSAHAEATMADAVRSVLGLTKDRLSDERAIDLVMHPASNHYFAESLNLSTLGKLTRTMHHPHFTFRKKLSHTADSQDQRHRTTPASRPVLARHVIGGRPDYVTPVLIRTHAAVAAYYEEVMHTVWRDGIEPLLHEGVAEEYVMYLLPNAFPIRFEESGDLLSLHHKWTKRLCYTAQEEIWNACRDEVLQVKQIAPRLVEHIFAPCTLRQLAGEQPYCPEGDRFCGVPVWKLDVAEYTRLI